MDIRNKNSRKPVFRFRLLGERNFAKVSACHFQPISKNKPIRYTIPPMPTGAIRRLPTQQHTRKHHENRHLERQFPQRPPAPSTKLAGRPPSRHTRLTRTQTRPRQIPGRRPANDGLALRLERPKNLQRRRHHQPSRAARRTLRPARPPR